VRVSDDAATYIEALDEPRRSEVRELHELIVATLPDLPVEVAGSGIGYGPFHYRYASGREGDAHLISLASRKTAISLYVLSVVDGDYLAPRYADRLPKTSIGKSCVRIKRLADVDRDALRDLLREAGEHPPAGAV
jgi:hypothetical protein